jgi:Helix-turn-helix domain
MPEPTEPEHAQNPEIVNDQTLPDQPDQAWLTRQETEQRLGKTKSTIERLVLMKALRSKLRKRPGKKPERLYKTEDVMKLVRIQLEKEAATLDSIDLITARRRELVERSGVKKLTPPAEPTTDGANGNGLNASTIQDVLMRMFGARAGAPLQLEAAAAPGTTQFWLSLEEAAREFNLSEKYLREAARAGRVLAVNGGPHGALRIQRKSLEAFAG